MSFSRIRAPGLWTFDSVVLGAELEAFDANLAHAIDGDQGGVYSLQHTLTIGGAPGVGIEFDVQLDAADVVAHGTLTVDDSLFQNGQAFFADEATFSGPNFVVTSPFLIFGDSSADLFAFNAHGAFNATVNFNDAVFCNDGLNISGELFAGDVALSGFLDANGNCFFGSGSGFIEFLGNVTARTVMAFADNGKVAWRNKTIAAAGNQTVVAALFDTVLIPNGVMAAGNIITIDDTGAQDGMRIEFTTLDTANANTITTPAALTTPLKNVSGQYQTVAYQRIAGVWQVASRSLLA